MIRWRFIVAVLRRLALIGLAVLSVALTLRHVVLSPDEISVPFDWLQFELATQKLDGSSLYVWEFRGSFEYSYRYSPLFAYVMVPFVALGLTIWRLLHLAVLLFLPWRVVLITMIAWPFWEDVYNANVMTFVLVAGWLAINGSRSGTIAYLLLAALVPRPLMLPLVVWILWKQPWSRWPVAIGLVAYAGLTIATGEAGGFVGALTRGGGMIEFERNYGPSRWFGWAWLIVGVPLAGWLLWKGRIGFASLAISPYLLPYHFIVALWETARTTDKPMISYLRDRLAGLMSRLRPISASSRPGRPAP